MATAWYVVRRGFRGRAVPTLGLVLMVAIASGSVAALVAGARRTDAAFPRFVEHAGATGDVNVFAQLDPEVPFFADDQAELKRLLDDLPEVERVTRATLLIVEGTDETGERQRLLGNIELDPGRDLVFGRPMVVEGTWPADGDAGAVAVDEELAARADLQVGDTYRVAPYTTEQFGPAGEGADVRPDGPEVDLRVDAIFRHPIDLQPVELDQTGIYVDHSGLHLTPAYWTEHGPDLARYGVGAVVDLAPGASLDDLERALQQRIPDQFMLDTESINGSVDVLESIQEAIDLQARGMLVVAGVTGVTGIALIWLLLGRKAGADRVRDGIFDDLGLGTRGRAAVSALEGVLTGVVGAGLGAVGAVVASNWVPFGLASRAELDPGIDVDIPVLGGVALMTVLVVMTGGAAARRRASRVRTAASSNVADALATRGLAPVPTTGVRFALQAERAGGTVPVRAAFAGVALAAGVIIAVVTLGASMDQVRDDPARRGAYGDAAVGNAASPEAADEIAARLDENPDVVGYAGEVANEVRIDDQRVWVVGVFDGEGELSPRVVEGRPPQAADEIILGGPVLRRMGVGIGDTVSVTFTGEPVEIEVVGQALLEDVDGLYGGPGKAGLVHASALDALDPGRSESANPMWFVVRFRDGVDHADALARLQEDFPNAVATSRLPADLKNLDRLGGLVVLLAVLVGVLGAGAALLAMVGAVSRRRRELAVLRTLGFARRQAAGTVAWQATTFALVGLAVGVPLGLVVGRRGWIAVADGVGIEPSPVVPVGLTLAVIGATLLALNVVAVAPAWLASRVRPADVLRAE